MDLSSPLTRTLTSRGSAEPIRKFVTFPSRHTMSTVNPPAPAGPHQPAGQALGRAGRQLDFARVTLEEHLPDRGGLAEVAVDLEVAYPGNRAVRFGFTLWARWASTIARAVSPSCSRA